MFEILSTRNQSLEYLIPDISELLSLHTRRMSFITDETTARSIEDWVSFNRRDPCYFLVSEYSLFSLCITDRYKDTREISLLLTHPDHMGKGYGRLLLSHTLLDMPKKRSIRLNVLASNKPAIKLYQSLGFCIENPDASILTMSIPKS